MSAITRPDLRSRATQDDILLAFADRLREYDLLNEQNVVVSDQPVPESFPGGGFCIVIAPGPGEFPRELWSAAHHSQATEDGSVVIGIYTEIRRDRRGRREATLFGRRKQSETVDDEKRRPSLMAWKREILRLLTVWSPANPSWNGNSPVPPVTTYQSWEPSGPLQVGDVIETVPICREIPQPVRSTGVLDVPEHPGWIGLQLTFSCTWDWELYV